MFLTLLAKDWKKPKQNWTQPQPQPQLQLQLQPQNQHTHTHTHHTKGLGMFASRNVDF